MAPTPVPLPEALRAVLDFANTIDVEAGTDLLAGEPAALSDWLAGAGLVASGTVAGPEHLALAVDLRAGLRAAALRNNGQQPPEDELAAGEQALSRLPLRAELTGPALVPGTADPVLAGLGRLAAGYAAAVAAGTWSRLRRCPAGDCQWVFWDSSPAAGRRWCTMRVCGNRAKARAYANRRRADG